MIFGRDSVLLIEFIKSVTKSSDGVLINSSITRGDVKAEFRVGSQADKFSMNFANPCYLFLPNIPSEAWVA